MTTQREIQESTVEAMVEAHCEGTMREALEAVILPLLAQAWEEGMLHGHNSPKRLLDKWEDNPYTTEAQVDGL